VQTCGDCPGRGRNDGNRAFDRALALRLQHCLRHLLHEQGDAIGTFDDVLPDARRQQLVADYAVDHGADLAFRQPIDRHGGHVRPPDPGRIEFRAEYHNH
jgi:hypothetical protein